MTRLALILAAGLGAAPAQVSDSLRDALLLYVPFDGGTDARYARGDARIYSAPDLKSLDKAEAGTGRADVEIARGAGVRGDALRFRSVNRAALFLKAAGNTAYSPTDWSGTASFWLRLDPATDLQGFSDPIQITDKDYDNACIWVDFSKDERPRHFRLGVFGDRSAWNPDRVPPDKNPAFLKRLVAVQKPPFSGKRWTHVAITWSGLGSKSGWARLYVDGQPMGTAEGIREPFTWAPEKALIRLGVNYAGLFDELAIFRRVLTEAEVKRLGSGRDLLAGRE